MLNKITPEKFDRLMEQLLELGINSGDALKDVISLIFDKVRRHSTCERRAVV